MLKVTGTPDSIGAFTECKPCSNPAKSKDGQCDNVRDMDLMLDELPLPSGNRLGFTPSDLQWLPDTSYYRFIAGDKIKEDCYTCTALCLGLQDSSELDTHCFMLTQLLQPLSANHTEYCSKCALYCSDISGCASFCMTFETFAIGMVIAFLIVGLPFLIFAVICLRAKTIRVQLRDALADRTCDQGHPVSKTDNFCHMCGIPLGGFLKHERTPRDRDIINRDSPVVIPSYNVQQ